MKTGWKLWGAVAVVGMLVGTMAAVGEGVVTATGMAPGMAPGTAPATQAAKKAPKYILPESFNLKATLADPPADDSEITKGEIAEILKVQGERTEEQVKRAKSEETLTAYAFADVLGEGFDAAKLPVTDKMLKQVEVDAKAVSDMAKKYWSRKRPWQLEPKIEVCVEKPENASYPSGHSTRGTVWAMVLCELYPEKKAALMARAKEIGDDRIIGGVHYRSDVTAGEKLGRLIGEKIIASEAFQADLSKAKAEVAGSR